MPLLLLTSYAHPASRNVAEVRAEFCSSVEPVGDREGVETALLLATSNNTHVVGTPANVDLNALPDPSDAAYFGTGYVPVAVALEGTFGSAFAHRLPPEGLHGTHPQRAESVPTRQIVIADGDLARNGREGEKYYPWGWTATRGNSSATGNSWSTRCCTWPTATGGWTCARARCALRCSTKKACREDRLMWQIINVGAPVGLLLAFGAAWLLARRKKYS